MIQRTTVRAILIILLAGLVRPGSEKAAARQEGGCGDAATPIHMIQGSGDRTPEAGNVHTIEGVVTADLQDRNTQFGGFFMQEEDADSDDELTTSEGIFVDSTLSRVDVKVGDVVRVTGTAFEYNSDNVTLTQLRRVKSLEVCSSEASVTPVEVDLPIENLADWECFEGMVITFPQELTAGDLYNLGRYGEIRLSAGGRLIQPTNMAAPGSAAQALQAENDRRLVLLDDGNNQQNLDPTVYPAGGLSNTNLLRSGDVVSGLTGVVDQRFGLYRVHATQPPAFTPANPRPAESPVFEGRLRVASFNVLNYFNGDGTGGGFPTPRGANTPEEFERQKTKIVNAILGLNADVIAIMEIENDGDGPDSAAADLVNGLNEAAGSEVYAYIPDPAGLKAPTGIENDPASGDEIKQTILYRVETVKPIGDPVLTLDSPFDIRRPPVAQAFEEIASGEQFIVVANHFKSKGCTDASGENDDLGDGQSCWNLERKQAAQTLLASLATDPTQSGDPDVLLVGDLNAYAQEDPLQILTGAGYTNLTQQFAGESDYSYIYFGLSGSLDHALSSASLTPQITGAGTWHINADEVRALDYNIEFKSANHVESLYDPGPYRSADHDPLVVGLTLGGGSNGDETTAPDDLNDSSGGMAAIIAGLIAVLIAMIAGLFMGRGKKK
ncbi:MAG: ExeM/NucH family extracellular endonuclease [Chloroflexi bacterium]|nr:ExeM/NucH family extracellular endonuclease [Chloroflexota bacterium]